MDKITDVAENMTEERALEQVNEARNWKIISKLWQTESKNGMDDAAVGAYIRGVFDMSTAAANIIKMVFKKLEKPEGSEDK